MNICFMLKYRLYNDIDKLGDFVMRIYQDIVVSVLRLFKSVEWKYF